MHLAPLLELAPADIGDFMWMWEVESILLLEETVEAWS
jgi:hypothetical protein